MQKKSEEKITVAKFTGSPYFILFFLSDTYLILINCWRSKSDINKIVCALIFLCVQVCYLNLERKPNIISVDNPVFVYWVIFCSSHDVP